MPTGSPVTYSPFFKSAKHPRDWSFPEYLKYSHNATLTPRRILDSWSKSLVYITKCSDKEFSHAHRKRAAELLKRYKEKGKGSDKAYGQEWLAEKAGKGKGNSTGAAAGASVNIGAVFQGPVVGSTVPISQSSLQQAAVPAPQEATRDGVSGEEREAIDTPAEDTEASEEAASDDEEYQPPIKSENPPPYPQNPTLGSSPFTTLWREMLPSHKWILSSGRVVEDIIHTACLSMDPTTFANSLAHAFILDTSDPAHKGWFTKPEWTEICSRIPPLPEPDLHLAQSMKRFFGVKTPDLLREVLNKTDYVPEGKTYDPKIHYNAQWADVVFRRFLMLLEAPGEPLRTAHLEDWYSGYIWSSILDDCLLNLPQMTVERKESPCRASSIRKNRNRQSSKSSRMKIGARLDAIIRTVEDDYYEYGGMEAAKTFVGGERSTKWLGDGFKLCRALRDMLMRLHVLLGDEEGEEIKGERKKIQVVGVATGGLALQWVRMGNVGGYVCCLQRERVMGVPKSVGGLHELMKLLMSVAQMKQVIKDSAATIEDRHAAKSETDLLNELLGGAATGEASRVTPERMGSPRLPWTLDTP